MPESLTWLPMHCFDAEAGALSGEAQGVHWHRHEAVYARWARHPCSQLLRMLARCLECHALCCRAVTSPTGRSASGCAALCPLAVQHDHAGPCACACPAAAGSSELHLIGMTKVAQEHADMPVHIRLFRGGPLLLPPAACLHGMPAEPQERGLFLGTAAAHPATLCA